jgi:oligopeptidase B
VLAAGQPFFQLGGYEVSPDNRLLAYTVDTVGRRQYRLLILDLLSGKLLSDQLDNVESDVTWADDGSTLLYVEKDPVTLLGRRVRSHRLGSHATADILIYEEADESFDLTVDRSKSERFLYIGAESTTSSEWRYAPVGAAPAFQVFLPRQPDHEYQIEHLDDRFLIRTNWHAENFRLMSVTVAAERDQRSWQEIVPHSPDVFIHDFDLFTRFLAISERSGGLRKIRVQTWQGESWHLAASDATYTMHLGANPELDVMDLRYTYSSLTTPTSTYDYNIERRSHTLLKREPVLGTFDPADYVSEFLWATARDGALVPVSTVRHRETRLDGTAPLLLYAYGSYGICIDPQFSVARLSLLNRGFVYAIAHVRGGQELGRRWYNGGRLLNKWNTFHDFVDATDFLVAAGYADPRRVFASGGSAGGLLMGVVMNVAPEKYAGIVANVPFVDVVTTMLDESIPLTTLEYDEWGNPKQRRYYDYMLSYAPYDNVSQCRYPPLLATTGLWDSQVQYYEPAKWVARLRAMNPGGAPALLHINMEAGHGGKSGRYEHVREIAREYGFIMHLSQQMAVQVDQVRSE